MKEDKQIAKPMFGELQLSAAMDDVVDLVASIAPGITFRYFALSPETIGLLLKEKVLLSAHPEEAENAVSADGLYFGIKKKEIGEPGSIYNNQIRSVLGARKPDYQFTENEITFKATYDVPVHIKLIPEDDPKIQYLNYPNQEFWGDDIVFLPNPLKEYLEEIGGGKHESDKTG